MYLQAVGSISPFKPSSFVCHGGDGSILNKSAFMWQLNSLSDTAHRCLGFLSFFFFFDMGKHWNLVLYRGLIFQHVIITSQYICIAQLLSLAGSHERSRCTGSQICLPETVWELPDSVRRTEKKPWEWEAANTGTNLPPCVGMTVLFAVKIFTWALALSAANFDLGATESLLLAQWGS